MLLFLAGMVTTSFGQSHKSNLRAIGKNYGDSIVLRWAPASYTLWQQYMKGGYIVERISLDTATGKMTGFERLTSEALHVWPLERMKGELPRNSRYAAIAAQALYGKSFAVQANASATSNAAMQQAGQQESRYGFALLAADLAPYAANAMALRFVDKQISKTRNYLYRLIGIRSPANDTVSVLINGNAIVRAPQAPNINAQSGDHSVQLSWGLPLGESYTGFYMERSEDGARFRRLNEVPLAQTLPEANKEPVYYYSDSLKINYKTYTYRLVAVDAFGDETLPSATVTAMGSDLEAPEAPKLVEARSVDMKTVQLQWHKVKREKDFVGYMVQRSDSVNGPFKYVNTDPLNPADTSFTDKKEDLYSENFYRVIAVDSARNGAFSNTVYTIIMDDQPPAKPLGLQGKIDSNGIVHLQWNRGAERDIEGYRVYMANQADHQFINISRNIVEDTLYQDTITLKTLTRKIYYKIAAVDKNRNASELSDWLELTRPDKIPPAPPLLIHYEVGSNSVVIEAIGSPSADVKRYVFLRRSADAGWDTLESFPAKEKNMRLRDTAINPEKEYEYQLMAYDENGLFSFADKSLRLKTIPPLYKPGPASINASYDKKIRAIVLRWAFSGDGDYSFVVYRSLGTEPLMVYKHLDKKLSAFEDRNLPEKEGVYSYAIKVLYATGGESRLSGKVPVSIE